MNKMGQIYILVALVLSIVIYSLVQVANYVGQENIDSDFESLASNFEKESAKMINSMIAAGKEEPEIRTAFLDFSLEFASYARTVNPNFGMLFGYKDSSGVTIGNYLEKPSRIKNKETDAIIVADIPPCYGQIPAGISFDGLGEIINIDQLIIEECITEHIIDLPTKIKIEVDYDSQNIAYSVVEFKDSKPYEVFAVSWEEQGPQIKVFTSGIGGED